MNRIAIEFEAVADANCWAPIPVAVRLRRLLKLALRVCGLRAVVVREVAE